MRHDHYFLRVESLFIYSCREREKFKNNEVKTVFFAQKFSLQEQT